MRFVSGRPVVLAGCLLAACTADIYGQSAVNVTQYHNHLTRDGLYVDPAFTQSAAANLKRDTNFNGAIPGNVLAQPLYLEGGPNGQALVIAVTESNYVCALDPGTGAIVWARQVGTPVPLSSMPCGNIDPLGITGTPAVDLASRAIFFDAMTTPDRGTNKSHLIYSLNVDTGAINSGWPVNVNATAQFSSETFTSATQNQRGALAVINGTVYTPYGGNYGDCGTYYGWVVGVSISSPGTVHSWATTANGGGAWSVGGIASDGTFPYVATGNTFNVATWNGGEAIIRLQPGPVFSSVTSNYWAPTYWQSLDSGDTDIGGSGPLLVTVPGASPSNLVVALGKNGNAYLLDRDNLGGISAPLAVATVSTNSGSFSPIIQGAATYQTKQGTYVVLRGNSTQLTAFQITPTSPPNIVSAWSVAENGKGSPFVTSTDGTNNVVVWGIGSGSSGDQRLHGFDGDTGAVIFSGGHANELMSGTESLNTAIAARGRIYAANDGQVCAFTVPVAPINLSNLAAKPNGTFAFSFTNIPGMSFSVYSTTNVQPGMATWTRQGLATEVSPGKFQYSQSVQPTTPPAFYRVSSP